MRRFVSTLVLVALVLGMTVSDRVPWIPASVVLGQDVSTNSYVSVLRYNLSSTSVIYCKGSERFLQGTGSATTSGSSTTVTAVAGTPFDPVVAPTSSVSTAILFDGLALNMVSAKASGSSITIDSAINLTTNTGFFYMNFACGSGAEDGWMPMAKFGRTATLGFEVNAQVTASGIDMRVECRSSAPDSGPIQVFPSCSPGACNTFQNYVQTASGITARTAVAIPEPWKECRVGMKIDTTNTGPNLVNVYLMGRL